MFLVLGLQGSAAAQGGPERDNDYPVRPIRLLVGVPPGGSTDLVARIVAGEFLKTFEEFPPRQKPASFSIDQALEKARENEKKLAAAGGAR